MARPNNFPTGQLNEVPAEFIELKDRPDKEGDGGNLRAQLNIIKRNGKNAGFLKKERLKDGKTE